MVDFIVFAFNRFVFRIADFIKHWYLGGFKVFANFFISILEKLDKFFAIKITWRNFFAPLYQDQSIISHILGPIFRFFRLVLGGILYVSLIVAAIFIFLIWAAIPLCLVFKITEYFIGGKIFGKNCNL